MHAGIWYLDLTETSYIGVGLGAVSVSAGGERISLHQTAVSAADLGSVVLPTSQHNTFNVVSFNANDSGSPTVNFPLTAIYASGAIGSAQGAAGYEAHVPAGDHTYSWTTGSERRVVAAAFVVNSFASWIADYPVASLTDPADDPDGDGIPNGIEALFGTHPNQPSPGLGDLATTTTTATFTHPHNESPPDDLSIFYQWSTNLVDWYDCDGTSSPDAGVTTVNLIESNTVGTTTTVTLESNDSMNRLFLRVGARQN